MQCNQCGSDHTQRLEVAHDAGTQGISATSRTAEIGSISGALGLSGSVTTTSGISRSVLAQKAAPPEKRSLTAVLLLALIGFLCLRGNIWVVTLGLAMMAVGIYGLYNSIRFNSEYWPKLYQRWLNSWMCLKCGNIYHKQ
jgi:hypothetical protein